MVEYATMHHEVCKMVEPSFYCTRLWSIFKTTKKLPAHDNVSSHPVTSPNSKRGQLTDVVLYSSYGHPRPRLTVFLTTACANHSTHLNLGYLTLLYVLIPYVKKSQRIHGCVLNEACIYKDT